ncbi:MAG: DegT/DnrJ/EryC1/StrS aminotransferase family protein [Bdellovibrionales bacterium]|nr:DegT/DnrJ/EryC1/StrS aminotransferase family protein [Bdellovibrionales bacterium]
MIDLQTHTEDFTKDSRFFLSIFKEVLEPSLEGRYAQSFEQDFAQHLGSVYSISTHSLARSLQKCFDYFSIGEWDEVICPSWLSTQYIQTVISSKISPVFAEISPYTLGIDFRDVSHKLSSKTKAVIMTYPYGIPSDISYLQNLCKEKGILLIEIVPQAFATKYRGKNIGTFGDVGLIEFHPKHMYSEANSGIVATDCDALAFALRNDPKRNKEVDSSFSEMEGAIGLWILDYLDKNQDKRMHLAQRLDKSFEIIPNVSIFHELCGAQWDRQIYPLRVSSHVREELFDLLKSQGVQVIKPQSPSHLHSFIQAHLRPPQLIQTERLSKEILLIPISAGLSKQEEITLTETVNSFFLHRRDLRYFA